MSSSSSSRSTTTFFTVSRMKNTATAIIVFDILLLLAWCGNSLYLALNLDIDCFHSQTIIHFLILIHFPLCIQMANMVGDITHEQRKAEEKGLRLTRLPYYAYLPLAWAVTGLLSLSGDVVLLIWGIVDYRSTVHVDECNDARIVHITFDAIAVTTCLISICWFLIFSIYTIRERENTFNSL